MLEISKTLWRYRILVALTFILMAGIDFVLGSLRMLITQGGMFIIGVVIGHMHRVKAVVAHVDISSKMSRPDV